MYECIWHFSILLQYRGRLNVFFLKHGKIRIFVYKLKTLYPRIRLSNTDPDPGDKLNEDPCKTGSETLSIVKLHCTKCAVHIYCYTQEDKGTMSEDFVQPQGSIHSKRQKGCGSKYPHIAATRKPTEWFNYAWTNDEVCLLQFFGIFCSILLWSVNI